MVNNFKSNNIKYPKYFSKFSILSDWFDNENSPKIINKNKDVYE